MRFLLPSILIFAIALPCVKGEEKLSFNRDIRPILSDKCFYCHGPDKNTREADLRLDVRESAVELEAIVPGDVKASESYWRITSDDEDEMMLIFLLVVGVHPIFLSYYDQYQSLFDTSDPQ